MMKILLIYPTTTTAKKPNKFKKAFLPPLNLAILDRLTQLAGSNHVVRIINDVVETIDFDADCDLVGITALTPQAERAYQIADRFRSRGKKVVLGGVHPSMLPKEAIQHADAVVIGEAEDVWADLLSDVEKGTLKQLYADEDYHDLKKLIVPKWDNFNLSIYRRSFGRNLPRMPIYTTRGCVYNCKYCAVSKFFGRKYRSKPVENVIKEIKAMGAESYLFTDDNIACDPDYSESLFKSISSSFNGIRWLSQCSASILKNPHLIELAGKAGCRSLVFGIESINIKNLKDIKKTFNDPDRFLELHRRCSAAGIDAIYSFIFGMDHDLIKNLWDTLTYLKKNKIWNAVFWILTPLPGTALFDEMVAADRIVDYDWSNYDLTKVVFKPINFSADDLSKNFWNIYQSFYSISNILDKLFNAHRTETFFKYYMKFLINQFFSRNRVLKNIHPITMGIKKYERRTTI